MPRKKTNETSAPTPTEERLPELVEVTTASAILGTETDGGAARREAEEARELGETVRDVERRKEPAKEGPRYPDIVVERARFTGNLVDFVSYAGRTLRAESGERMIMRAFENDVYKGETPEAVLERIGEWVTLR